MPLITNDRLTLLKLIAVIAMVIDHYNKFINPDYSQALFAIGRLALPIFLFVLAFNLSRIQPAKMPPIALRLVVFGLLATPAYNAMGGTIWGGWWPLNVLFLLATLVMLVYLLTVQLERPWLQHLRSPAVFLLFIVAGALSEFFWVGLALGLVMWKFFVVFSRGENEQQKGRADIYFLALCGVAASFLLCVINGNGWAIASIPVVALVLCIPVIKLPRFKWFFYWFYPAHLGALWIIGN